MAKLKHLLALILCFSLVLSCVPLAYAEESENEVTYETTSQEETISPTESEEILEISETMPTMLASGDDLTWVLESDGTLTITGTGAMNYQIPWKAYNSQITSVVIGEGVTTVAGSAFYECFNLTSVSLPSTLKNINDSAFYRCLKLESINIPASVTSISSSAFAACETMTGIWVDEANANYSSDASGVLYNKDKTELIFCPRGFSGSYEIPSGVTAIKYEAFEDCTGLTGITIADSVTTIENYAFNGCTALTDFTIPANVATIGSSAFYNCDALTAVTIPGNVVSLGGSAFSSCNKLTSVSFENGLVSIGDWAFAYCDALTDVKLPDTLVSISERTFWDCDSLASITIPRKVSHIDYYAFYGCPLTEIKFEGNAPVIESDSFYHYNTTITAYYPAGDATWTEEVLNGFYGATFNWTPYEKDAAGEDENLFTVASGTCGDNLTWILMSDGTLTVTGTGSMNYNIPWKSYASQITSVVIDEGVTTIAGSAFYECFNLTSVSLPSTLKNINDSAFYRCLKLPIILIPVGVTSISSSAFSGCTAMTDIRVDEANANYSSDASGVLYNKDKTELIFCPRGFSGSYEIPSGVTAIKYEAFEDCTGLTGITIADSVTTIENYAFNGCTALTDFTIPANVATIGSSAFYNCDALTAVTIPGNVVSLGGSAFSSCNKLTSVSFENGLVSIGDWAFAYCDALTDVKLPDTLVSISERTFWDCDSLASIAIPGKVSHIDYYAFYGCPLTEIKFEGNAPVIESDSFYHYNTTITAYYPAEDATWTEEVLNGSYGATFNWTPYEKQSVEEEPLHLLASGTWGDNNLSWSLMSDGALTVTGTGSMNYEIPWKAYCAMVTSVEIGEGVTTVAGSAFYECFNLTSVSLPSTLKNINDSAFYRCLKLESINIPASVTSISSSAFAACETMTDIRVDEANANYSSDASGVLYNKDKTELIFCPRGFSGSYEIPSGVTAIKYEAFEDCTGLTGITIADTVITIENYAFNGCTGLSDFTIPTNVATIGSSAFYNCDALTAVTIPGNVVSLGGSAFSSCNKLTSVSFENGLVSIGDWAFAYCDALTDVKLPDTLVSISERTFWDCDSLASITVPRKVSHIDYYAFYGCPLTEIKFEGNAPVIESDSFYHYNTTITAYYPAGDATWTEEVLNGSYGATFNWVPYDPGLSPDDDTAVFIIAQGSCGANVSWKIMSDGRLVIYGSGSMQFMMRSGSAPWSAYSNQITSIVVTSGVNSIADNAFTGCSNVTTVSVADTVTTIGNEAFIGCESLETVTFTGNAPEIGENCFEDINVSIQYPEENDTWTEEVQESFGSEITWVSFNKNQAHSYADNVDGICDECGVDRAAVEHRQVTHMFRMYNPNTGEHFYTGSEEERDNLIEVGWQYEGVGFTFPANTGAPVHRLFQPSTGEHLYTMDEAEKDRLMAEGWNYEGVAFNSAYDTEAVQHRLHNPNATVGAYHFTFSLEEKDTLIAAGWEYQGIGWYSCWK